MQKLKKLSNMMKKFNSEITQDLLIRCSRWTPMFAWKPVKCIESGKTQWLKTCFRSDIILLGRRYISPDSLLKYLQTGDTTMHADPYVCKTNDLSLLFQCSTIMWNRRYAWFPKSVIHGNSRKILWLKSYYTGTGLSTQYSVKYSVDVTEHQRTLLSLMER